MIIDDEVSLIGSANIDNWSLIWNKKNIFVVQNKKFSTKLEDIFKYIKEAFSRIFVQ